MVIGDGVGDDTRRVIATFLSDERVHWFDKPKSARVAELHRHTAIQNFETSYVTYLGDDDLFLKNHLEIMADELLSSDFSHPLPVYLNQRSKIGVFATTDLSQQHWIDWHLQFPYRNTISLTGVAHTREAYLSLPYGWRETPADRLPDQYMWQQFFEARDLKFSSCQSSTTIKSPARFFNQTQRRRHIEKWFQDSENQAFFERWNSRIRNKMRRRARLVALLGRSSPRHLSGDS